MIQEYDEDAEDDEKDENYESIKISLEKMQTHCTDLAGLKLADMTAGTISTESNASTNGDDKEENRIVDTINEVYSFGRNESGMLGMEDNRGRLRPSPINFCGVVELTRVSKVSCSWYHSVALTDVGLCIRGVTVLMVRLVIEIETTSYNLGWWNGLQSKW